MRALVPLLPSLPTLANTPIMSNRMPFKSMVAPTAGRPGKTFLSNSHPTTATRRCSVLSSSFSQRPVPTGTVRIWLYSGATPNTCPLVEPYSLTARISSRLITGDRERRV